MFLSSSIINMDRRSNRATQSSLLALLFLSLVVKGIVALTPKVKPVYLDRSSFPSDFLFGTASASYQYEGAASEGGRSPSIWDTWTHEHPERILDGSNGDVAVDQYHRYKEDVAIMKDTGLDAYRFSISWSRILPTGKLSGGVNEEGIQYYNNLIDELVNNGIQPCVTLFHWDLPQTLEDEYGGFLSPKILDDFQDFVELCFQRFGDRVKYWITFNQPWVFITAGYARGLSPPGRCSEWQNLNCSGGNSATEPYIVGRHQLLAHAAAVKLYRENYKATQEGMIGITLVTHWFVPYNCTEQDEDAAQRALDFMFGWFMHPVTYGDYPESMKSLVGNRLPKFSEEESKMLNQSIDFLGLNYYTGNYAANDESEPVYASFLTDSRAVLTSERNGIPIGPQAGSNNLHVYPTGLRDLLLYIKNNYSNPLIYITENGVSEINNTTLPLEEQLADTMRIQSYYCHFYYLKKAMESGVNVKGFYAWSLLDNFEWRFGYTERFGIYYIDYINGLKRIPKDSAYWFKQFLKLNGSLLLKTDYNSQIQSF